MIKANELRLGNFVKAPLDEVMKVTVLGHVNYPDYIHAQMCECSGINGFEPIPLTEEWLIKFGFEKRDSVFVLQPNLENVEYRIAEFPSGTWVVSKGFFKWNSEISSVKFIHSLQNLYFALTGEELTIK